MEEFTQDQKARLSELFHEELGKTPTVIGERDWKETTGEDVDKARIRAYKRFVFEGIAPSRVEFQIKGADLVGVIRKQGFRDTDKS